MSQTVSAVDAEKDITMSLFHLLASLVRNVVAMEMTSSPKNANATITNAKFDPRHAATPGQLFWEQQHPLELCQQLRRHI